MLLLNSNDKAGYLFKEGEVLNMWDKLDPMQQPDIHTIGEYINNKLWDDFHMRMVTEYNLKTQVDYSLCSMQKGWNIHFQEDNNRSLCTAYPMEGYFIALIVIGEREIAKTESLLNDCSSYIQNLYNETTSVCGAKWLMIHVTTKEILEDVYKLIELRSLINTSFKITELAAV